MLKFLTHEVIFGDVKIVTSIDDKKGYFVCQDNVVNVVNRKVKDLTDFCFSKKAKVFFNNNVYSHVFVITQENFTTTENSELTFLTLNLTCAFWSYEAQKGNVLAFSIIKSIANGDSMLEKYLRVAFG